MKKIIFLFLVFGFLAGKAQEEKSRFIKKGLFRTTATLSAGVLLKEKTSMIYGQGIIEYYVADNVSMRGESFYMVKATYNGDPTFAVYYPHISANHQIFAGANFHFPTKSHFDPYIGFEPGIAIVTAALSPGTTGGEYLSKQTGNPVIATILGFNYYFERFFHLFMEARYVHGKYLSDYPDPLSLSELRFSFGLGFNFNFKKKEGQK